MKNTADASLQLNSFLVPTAVGAHFSSKDGEAGGSTAKIDTVNKGSDWFWPLDMHACLHKEYHFPDKDNDFHDIKTRNESNSCSPVAAPTTCTTSLKSVHSLEQDPGKLLGYNKHNDHVSPHVCTEGTGEKAFRDVGGDCTKEATLLGDDACSAVSSSFCANDLLYFDKLSGFCDQSPSEGKDREVEGGMSECDEVLSHKESPQSSACQRCHSIIPSPSFNGVGSSKKRQLASEDDTKTLKVKFGDNTARFKLLLRSSFQDLQQEVEKRFKLKRDCFDMKFLDDEAEWVLLSCDADMIECIDIQIYWWQLYKADGAGIRSYKPCEKLYRKY